MKTKLILAASICANVGLLAFYLKKDATKIDLAAPPVVVVTNSAPPARIPEARTVRAEAKTVVTNDFQWSSVESQDYRDYIANLRAIGCPEETVRDIIIADVNKLYGSRMAALYPSAKDFKFWAVEDASQRAQDREREQKRRELEREKRALIKELLGVDYESEVARWSGRPDEDEWRFGFLSADKQAQLQALQDKYRELERAAWGEGRDRNNPEARARLVALRAQREAEMAQILGPQDYQEYQLRNSPIARNMRENLAAFQPSEEEFRKIFELRKGLDDQFGAMRDGSDVGVREQRQLAQQQLDQQIQEALGSRYAAYEMSQDPRYRELHEFAERNSLPQETVQSVYDVRRTAEEMRRTLERDATLAPEQRVAALTALANETRNALNSTMGEQAFKEYQRRGGNWVERLAQVEQRGQRGGNNGNNIGGGGGGGGRFQRGGRQ
jgi:hypothetical protein